MNAILFLTLPGNYHAPHRKIKASFELWPRWSFVPRYSQRIVVADSQTVVSSFERQPHATEIHSITIACHSSELRDTLYLYRLTARSIGFSNACVLIKHVIFHTN